MALHPFDLKGPSWDASKGCVTEDPAKPKQNRMGRTRKIINERLPQGGPSFGPFVGALDCKALKSPPNQKKPNQTKRQTDRPHWVSTPFLLQPTAVHGYYRTYGSGHSRLALRADIHI
jgi:hypothetical protein